MIKVVEAQAAIAKIVAATEAAGFIVGIVIVDENGDEVASYRMDGCRPRFIKVSLLKAYTSAMMDRTTESFKEEIDRRSLQISYYGDPMFTALPGGIPIVGHDGKTIGGIGVTGMTKMTDAALAATGLACFADHRVIPSEVEGQPQSS
jgi:glc operon protein GlcG